MAGLFEPKPLNLDIKNEHKPGKRNKRFEGAYFRKRMREIRKSLPKGMR